jgi:dCMP deaminase
MPKLPGLSKSKAMGMALLAARESPDPWMKVGCVGLSADRRIVASGYNSILDSKPEKLGWKDLEEFMGNRDQRRPFMVHAEAMICSKIRHRQVDDLVITLLPCVNCMKLLAAFGVKRVIYMEAYDKDQQAFQIATFFGIEIVKYTPRNGEEEV